MTERIFSLREQILSFKNNLPIPSKKGDKYFYVRVTSLESLLKLIFFLFFFLQMPYIEKKMGKYRKIDLIQAGLGGSGGCASDW